MGDLLIYGGPHGFYAPLIDACDRDPPAAVVILGDHDLDVPFRETLGPLFQAGIAMRWLAGNHDKASVEWHDRLFVDYPEGDLGSKVERLGGFAVAGLGGVFKQRVWYPREAMDGPSHVDRAAFLRWLSRTRRWRGGMPLKLRDAIFPEDVAALTGMRADILATHEAPTSHPFGFAGIDRAATLCHARVLVGPESYHVMDIVEVDHTQAKTEVYQDETNESRGLD